MKRNHKRTGLSMTAQDSTTTKQRMLAILTASFAPTVLDVLDESENHRGHGGFREGGETHFRVRIVSSAFKGKSRVDIHRMINTALAGELASGVHALAIEAKSDSDTPASSVVSADARESIHNWQQPRRPC